MPKIPMFHLLLSIKECFARKKVPPQQNLIPSSQKERKKEDTVSGQDKTKHVEDVEDSFARKERISGEYNDADNVASDVLGDEELEFSAKVAGKFLTSNHLVIQILIGDRLRLVKYNRNKYNSKNISHTDILSYLYSFTGKS